MDPILLLAGAVVSLLTLGVKKYAGTSSVGSLAAVLAFSLVAAGGSYFLQRAGMWESTLQILTTAGAFYAYFIKNGEDFVKGEFTH